MDKKTWTGLNRSGKNRTLTALVKSTSIYNDGTTGHLIRKSSGEFTWPAGKSSYISLNFELFIILCLGEIESILFRRREAAGRFVSLNVFGLICLLTARIFLIFKTSNFDPKTCFDLSDLKNCLKSKNGQFIIISF